MHDLCERVNAGISAARAGDRHVTAIELAERVFEETLNRSARGLALPTDVVSPVVRDVQPDEAAGTRAYSSAGISSINAIGAPSPCRCPSLSTRV